MMIAMPARATSTPATSQAVDGALAKYAPAVDILNAARP